MIVPVDSLSGNAAHHKVATRRQDGGREIAAREGGTAFAPTACDGEIGARLDAVREAQRSAGQRIAATTMSAALARVAARRSR
ncbi:hypothetical protein [Sorangium sp. So ce590]|uniref:hypothetical protein n=1 Tax=unclassified Sorangium TaxID=2621164 RepID=UPI003F610A5A